MKIKLYFLTGPRIVYIMIEFYSQVQALSHDHFHYPRWSREHLSKTRGTRILSTGCDEVFKVTGGLARACTSCKREVPPTHVVNKPPLHSPPPPPSPPHPPPAAAAAAFCLCQSFTHRHLLIIHYLTVVLLIGSADPSTSQHLNAKLLV